MRFVEARLVPNLEPRTSNAEPRNLERGTSNLELGTFRYTPSRVLHLCPSHPHRSGDCPRPHPPRPLLLLMRAFDWAIVVGYIVWVVVDGIRRAKGTNKVEGYFLGNRSLPWWVAGLSVVATQMSAVTNKVEGYFLGNRSLPWW